MDAYRIETVITEDGTLSISGLPFTAGERVEVIVRGQMVPPEDREKYPLRGMPVRYDDPFAGVAENDWKVLK